MSDETSEASSFRFLFSSESRGRTVLEFDTARDPVRGVIVTGATGSAGHGSKDRQREVELAISGQ